MLIALFATASHGQFRTDPDSLNIEFVGQVNLTGEPIADRLPDGTDLYVSGDIALMGDFRGIVYIVDISDPTAMQEIAQVEQDRDEKAAFKADTLQSRVDAALIWLP